MYVGHLATGLLVNSLVPMVPAAPIMYGAGFLDMLDGLFALIGVNHVKGNLDAGPYIYFDLVFVDWDHSLLMAAVWSVLFGVGAAQVYKSSPVSPSTVGVAAALSSFAHWLGDVPFHAADLAQRPYSSTHYGWGWWPRFMNWSWVFEGVLTGVCLGLAAVMYTRRAGGSFTRSGLAQWSSFGGVVAVHVALFANLSPWLSPMQFVATLPPPTDQRVYGALTAAGFILPGWLLTRMLDRADVQVFEARTAKRA